MAIFTIDAERANLMSKPHHVVIVGGGLSGLTCAIELHRAGVAFVLLEADARLGGRVQTDLIDGFRCDRGFQILLTAYPEAARLLDYARLDLRPFYPGCLVRANGRFHRLADPVRRPWDAIRSLRSPIGSFGDWAKVLRLRQAALRGELIDIYSRPQTTTLGYLRAAGISGDMIDRFFRPFLGGVFLESELATSSHKLEFVLRMFALGDNAVPARGMGEIPNQLASLLPAERIRTGTRVKRAQAGRVVLENGEELAARAVVIATDGVDAAHLAAQVSAPDFHPATCLYFASDEAPVREPILVLDGTGEGPVNNLCVLSNVSAEYAPPGKSLISASVLDGRKNTGDEMLTDVLDQMRSWFGPSVDAWRHLKTYHIPRALPAQPPETWEPVARPVRLGPGLFVCGDHRHTASINGAMASGRIAAESVIEFLG